MRRVGTGGQSRGHHEPRDMSPALARTLAVAALCAESQRETQCDSDDEFVSQEIDSEQNSQPYDVWESGQQKQDKTKPMMDCTEKTTKDCGTLTENRIVEEQQCPTVGDIHGCKYFGQFVLEVNSLAPLGCHTPDTKDIDGSSEAPSARNKLMRETFRLFIVYIAEGISGNHILCNVVARTKSGPVCGLLRWAESGDIYASFRGVPYAKQPLAELRFKELQPVEPWKDHLDATKEGPICYQTNVVYGRIMQPAGMSEACIYANIHVPLNAYGSEPHESIRIARASLGPSEGHLYRIEENKNLPILVVVHGGGFQGGSGDSDLHGPEYLITKNVIVITFNYRLNVFGYLSLNSAEVPGNQALRDVVTLLCWVRDNARHFGGDPDNVTLLGQSAGAVAAHIMTMSKAADGLYKRAFLMSGTATSSFYSASPLQSQQLANIFLMALGINSTDPQYIHEKLIQMPVEQLQMANAAMLEQFGFTTFVPTVESAFPGVTRVLDEDPEVLVAKGRGGDVPLVIGFTSVECEVFRRRLDQINIAQKIIDNQLLTVPPSIIFSTPPELLPDLANRVYQKYYNGSASTDGFISYCTDGLYKYPALKLAQQRASGDAPAFLYEFSYDGDKSVLREALDLNYKGAAHIEDLTYVFRVNSIVGAHTSFPSKDRDDYMKEWMTTFLVNFMQCSKPVCEPNYVWPELQPSYIHLQDIHEPLIYNTKGLTEEQKDIIQFFDSLRHK